MINKRGAGVPVFVWWLLGFIVVIIAITILINTPAWKIITAFSPAVIDQTSTSFGEYLGEGFEFFGYLFGEIPTFLVSITTNKWSPVIVVIAMWLLMFVTFGDIIATFGSFDSRVAWISALLITVIAANLKFVISILAFFVGILSIFGGAAVVLGIGTAFAAFIGVNLGIRSMAPWIMRRKAMMHAAKNAIETEKGAKKVSAAIKGMKEIGDELSRK